MKIDKVFKSESRANCYMIRFVPNWFERLFGVVSKCEAYYDTGDWYTFGGGSVYVDKNGLKLGNWNELGAAIDAYKNKLKHVGDE